jgi:hypothetical protein
MDSPSGVATRLRAVQTAVLPRSSTEGLAAEDTVARLLTRDWVPKPTVVPGVRQRDATRVIARNRDERIQIVQAARRIR